ncbi:gephyrin-like molybdotransferase Glp [Arthrobacter sp. Br18]|uniref:molybdopterin molybdotransferase MoeA n=1 Tax=Arthrobacter sp. Br18 TaxID=1312954 RepID=UPI0004AF5FA9|nr:gephyrin-like molybdotransferase Glp [Arthrobacter sp. Br18]
MIRSVVEHQQAVTALLQRSSNYSDASQDLALADARLRVLAVDIPAPGNLPPFDNSQMDGYAVHAADLGGGPLHLRVAAPVPAGIRPPALEPGTAAPIMTGAMIPDGTGAVVPIERATPSQFCPAYDTGTDFWVDLPDAAPGSFIRARGSDLAEGSLALPAGTLLAAPQLGLLAACGVGSVSVRSRFTVLLLSTGDEVAEPGTELAPGQIYDANTTLLEAALHEAGAVVIRHRAMSDDPDLLREALEGLERESVNLILSTGGISQGAYEVVKQALEDSSVDFLTVAMQPGGPQAIGAIGDVPFLGFPGNPVSALVSFEMFLRPALTRLVGAPAPRIALQARLESALESPAAKHQVRRGLYADGAVSLVGGTGSHLLHALAGSNALVHVPVGQSSAEAGDTVTIWLIDPAAGTAVPATSTPSTKEKQ